MARDEPPGPWGLALLRSLCPTELWIEDLPQSFGLRISEAIQLQPETVFFFCFQLHSGPLWGLEGEGISVPCCRSIKTPGG